MAEPVSAAVGSKLGAKLAKLGAAAKGAAKREGVGQLTSQHGIERVIAVLAGVLGTIVAIVLVSVLAVVGTAEPAQAGGGWPNAVPSDFQPMYDAAASAFAVNPYLLASIHDHESDFGRSTLPGVHSGANECGAAGPMQFGVVGVPPYNAPVTDCPGSPTAGAGPTWRTHWEAAEVGSLPAQRPESYPWQRESIKACADVPADVGCVYDSYDAIAAAAHKLHADGAVVNLDDPRTRDAVEAYNGDEAYITEVLEQARAWEAAGGIAGGSAALQGATKVFEPAHDVTIPAKYIAPGFNQDPIDARIWPNVRYLVEKYGLLITAGKETGHRSHGDGSAIDVIPRGDLSSQAVWDRTTGRAAKDLGWTPACGFSGSRPACPLVPAIEWIGYDGYENHGSPATCGGGCSQHLHVSWVSSTHGTPYLVTPEWMLAFPIRAGDA